MDQVLDQLEDQQLHTVLTTVTDSHQSNTQPNVTLIDIYDSITINSTERV